MLWTLIVTTSSLTCFVSAIVTGHRATCGVRGYTVAVITGGLVGISDAWALSNVANALVERVKLFSEARQDRYFRAVYLVAALWMLCGAAFIGDFISSAANAVTGCIAQHTAFL